MGSTLIITFLILVIVYLTYSLIKAKRKSKGSDKSVNNPNNSNHEPVRKSLSMINSTGKTVGSVSEDAVFISIPVSAFREPEFDISELLSRVATINDRSAGQEKQTKKTGGDRESKKIIESVKTEPKSETNDGGVEINVDENESLPDPDEDLKCMEDNDKKKDERQADDDSVYVDLSDF